MRKGFVLFAGLVLLSMLAACSDDTTPTPPKPSVDFEITTAAVPVAYTCSPYNTILAVQGGTAPYTWTLAAGSDPLPEGIVLTAEGGIFGVMTASATSASRCASPTAPPRPVARQGVRHERRRPSNPSLAVFFDGAATVCTSSTASWTPAIATCSSCSMTWT